MKNFAISFCEQEGDKIAITLHGVTQYYPLEPLPEVKQPEQPEQPELLVPEGITIKKSGFSSGDGLEIIFNEGKQALSFSGGVYNVYSGELLCAPIPCKLIPCKREDLKPGDTAFRTDVEDLDFSDIYWYCKILDAERHAFVSEGSNVISNNIPYAHWYKVIPR